ncbi:hypothetical protein [Pleurocapsa sp. PCC 7319]|uniref:hypothetical protein n=1 Tax=Pleurocapsa sp. PCC 7319 TaxID=118161 RepID=UPI000374A2E9|nr:hypothetical protein [Pleurocapsa sp. PCC 7319]
MKLLLRKFLIAIVVVGMVFYFKSQSMVASPIKILLPLYSYPNWYEPETYVWSDVARAAEQVPMVLMVSPLIPTMRKVYKI